MLSKDVEAKLFTVTVVYRINLKSVVFTCLEPRPSPSTQRDWGGGGS